MFIQAPKEMGFRCWIFQERDKASILEAYVHSVQEGNSPCDMERNRDSECIWEYSVVEECSRSRSAGTILVQRSTAQRSGVAQQVLN